MPHLLIMLLMDFQTVIVIGADMNRGYKYQFEGWRHNAVGRMLA